MITSFAEYEFDGQVYSITNENSCRVQFLQPTSYGTSLGECAELVPSEDKTEFGYSGDDKSCYLKIPMLPGDYNCSLSSMEGGKNVYQFTKTDEQLNVVEPPRKLQLTGKVLCMY